MFCKNTFLAIIQHHNSGTEGKNVTIFHIWSDTELVTLILGGHLETVLVVFLNSSKVSAMNIMSLDRHGYVLFLV